jgi:hypothetical protein
MSLKWGILKIMAFNTQMLEFPMIWGYPYLKNHSNISKDSLGFTGNHIMLNFS